VANGFSSTYDTAIILWECSYNIAQGLNDRASHECGCKGRMIQDAPPDGEDSFSHKNTTKSVPEFMVSSTNRHRIRTSYVDELLAMVHYVVRP
jgi:hypothetical protein